MTDRFNIYSQLVISATRIADITNCEQMLNRPAIHLVVYNLFCSVPSTVPVHFYELGGTGTLFANRPNQRRRNAVSLRPDAL